MFEKVKALLVDELQVNAADVTMEATLAGDLNINSLELADLIMMCEQKFGIEISEEDANRFVTVGDVVNYLDSL